MCHQKKRLLLNSDSVHIEQIFLKKKCIIQLQHYTNNYNNIYGRLTHYLICSGPSMIAALCLDTP